MYHSVKYCYDGDYSSEIIANEEHSLSNLSDGTISSEEIKDILSFLQGILGDNMFFDIISNELNAFSTKIDIRKGVVQEALDPLSPKLLIAKSFDEICALVSANKDDYFRLISEQFKALVNENSTTGQSKVLRPNTQKEQK